MNDFVLFVLILLSAIGVVAVIDFITKGITLLQELHREYKYLKRYKCNHEFKFNGQTFIEDDRKRTLIFTCKKCGESIHAEIYKDDLDFWEKLHSNKEEK